MPASDHMLAVAATHLRSGGLVAFPTETVYGLGADALNPRAVARVFAAKGRPSHNPLIVHVDGQNMAQQLVARWTSDARKLAAAFWPGPLSLVLPRQPAVPDAVTAGSPNVAVRCPDHELTRRLIAATGVPLVGPSANKSGFVSPTTAEHVVQDFPTALVLRESAEPATTDPRDPCPNPTLSAGLQVGHPLERILVLDGGPCVQGIESTVVRLPVAFGDPVVVLRQGVIAPHEISAVIGRSVEVLGPPASAHGKDTPALPDATPLQVSLDSPGLLDRHYAPRTRTFRFAATQWPEVLHALIDLPGDDGRQTMGVVLTIGTRGVPLPHVRMMMPTEPRQYAARLYSILREADELHAAAIYIEVPADLSHPVWAALVDRIRRASEPLT